MEKYKKRAKFIAFFIFSIVMVPTLYIAGQVISTSNKISAATVVPDGASAVIQAEPRNSSTNSSSTTTTTESSSVTETTTASSTTGLEKSSKTYTVVKGQTLWEIGQEQGIGVQELMKKNHLSTSIIFEGQILIY